MSERSWRVVLVTTVPIVAGALTSAVRDLGHRPVAIITARRRQRVPGRPQMTDETAPAGLDLLLPQHPRSIAPLVRACDPDLLLCWGFPWRIPAEALDVPRLGSVNCHPALLPRHRGPIPFAWTLRDGLTEYGITWHRMDANLDTGAILAQGTAPVADDDFDIEVVGPRTGAVALSLLPRVFERLAAGDPGDPQPDEGASWAGYFGDDYAAVDWSQPARVIHNQVRAWAFTFGMSPVIGPIAQIDGRRVRLTRTSLTDPGTEARRMAAGDGPIWIVASEPVES